MNISTKLRIATSLIFGITSVSCLLVFSSSNNFERLSIEAAKYDTMLVDMTNFRAASRQIGVEAAMSLYLTNGKKREPFEKEVTTAREKLRILKNNGVPGVPVGEATAKFSELEKN